jgi:NAD(P)H dehydrogenase (quinone)
MILVTGASGKTGRAIIKLLRNAGQPVRAMVHHSQQIAPLQNAGVNDVLIGDLQAQADLEKACNGIRALYHICPNVHPEEIAIARIAITAARKQGVERFVYHSVLHPQIEAMPHHWNKLRVEELLFTSGIPFTILQPCAYMQNVQGYWPQITDKGIYPVPYAVEARMSMVDLEDVAQTAVEVLVQPGYENGCFELCGPEALSQTEIASVLSQNLDREVRAVEIDRAEWETQAKSGGMSDYARQTLLKMFEYYNQFGLVGNPTGLACLLKRQPTTFDKYVRRVVSERNTAQIR